MRFVGISRATAAPTIREPQIIGLREVAELRPADAAEAITLRTRQYAAYQRKWMRRIPGLVAVDAERPADEVAEEILSLAERVGSVAE